MDAARLAGLTTVMAEPEDKPIKRTTRQARQGIDVKPVVLVLAISLALAIIALGLVFWYFAAN